MDVAACYTGEQPIPTEDLVRVVSLEQLRQEREQSLAEQDPSVLEDADTWREAYVLTGLAPADSDRDDAYEYYLGWVAATYNRVDNRVTVTDRQMDPSWAPILLLHEFVHALQQARRQRLADNMGGADPDQRAIYSRDRALASAAMVEGEATLYQYLATGEGYGFSPSELDRNGLVPAQVFWSSRPIDDAYSAFTYQHGAYWQHAAWLEGGSAAVAADVATPPSTTNRVMRGRDFDYPFTCLGACGFAEDPEVFEQQLEELNDVAVPVVPDRYRSVGRDTLGAWILSEEYGTGWFGDHFNVFRDDAAQETLVVWRMGFGKESTAESVARMLQYRVVDPEFAADGDFLRPTERIDVDGRFVTWIVSSSSIVSDLRIDRWESAHATDMDEPDEAAALRHFGCGGGLERVRWP